MNGPASVLRQKLLLRILPALAVLAVYFSFIGPRFSASAMKLEREILELKNAQLMGQSKFNELAQQKKDLLEDLVALRKQGGKRESVDMPRQQGFLGQSDYASQAIGRLSTAMSQHRLRVTEDGRQDWNSAREGIPKSVLELGESAKTKGGGSGASLWRVRFSGAYPDVYRTLEELSRDGVVIIPVSLDMAFPEGGRDLEWTIRVWI